MCLFPLYFEYLLAILPGVLSKNKNSYKMGFGSRVSAVYYFILATVTFSYSMVAFSIINSLSGFCESECPLPIKYDDTNTFGEIISLHVQGEWE